MRAFSIAAAGLLASATSAQASQYLVRNFCPFNVYLSFANTTQTETDELLPPGTAFLGSIVGQGNSVGVTNQQGQYWSATGWKAIFGTSTKDGTLWWSLSDLVGDPIAPRTFNVTSSGTKDDVCGHTTDYMSGVHNCPDNGATLTYNLCSANSLDDYSSNYAWSEASFRGTLGGDGDRVVIK
ncbi:hypothetical protein LTS09_008625 [Friedmanniomyces endolithicus]|nr:hypothetical protein LTS09_008625 [Friedmanniomyces endolithicus]